MINIWESIDLYKLNKSDIKLAEKVMAKAYYEAEEDFQFKKASKNLKFLEKLMHMKHFSLTQEKYQVL